MTISPLSLVIFGASGDLTQRKLVPALFSLQRKGRLPEELRIFGVARSELGDDVFRQRMKEGARSFSTGPQADSPWDESEWEQFASLLHYCAGDATAAGGLDALETRLRTFEGESQSSSSRDAVSGGRRLYYLAVAPHLYPAIVQGLGKAGMHRVPGESDTDAKDRNRPYRRLIIEKPFGSDLASARKLNQEIAAVFPEQETYRIDHYLGKETVQNLLVFRFANTLFEPLWNHNYIDHVQITVSEAVKVGDRGSYYDKAGVLRDMFQNHLLQLLTLIAMEAPSRFAADPLRNEKVKVLEAIPIPTLEEAAQRIVTGQYAGYHSEKGVAEDSRTPTYAALQLSVDNWRWRGVPFFLRSGKGLSQRFSEVIIQFRCPPHLMFPLPPGATLQCNRLAMCIQPDEGIHLNFQSKVPDKEGVVLQPADLEFHYHDTYSDTPLPEAYERLLQDALTGDAALFMRSDEIERAWAIMDPIIAATERSSSTPNESSRRNSGESGSGGHQGQARPPQPYEVGSEGPACADEFLARSGRAWLALCKHKE